MKIENFSFRIWSHKTKQYYSPRIEFLIVDKNHINEDITISDICSDLKELEIELWTGLCDKNGIKIYENDIIKVEDDGFSSFTDRIIFENNFGFLFKNQNIGVSLFDKKDMEIIGTIHENKYIQESIKK